MPDNSDSIHDDFHKNGENKSLEKADFSKIGFDTGLRGRYKKTVGRDNDEDSKSGKTLDSKAKRLHSPHQQQNVTTSEIENYIDEDVAILSHQSAGEFKPNKKIEQDGVVSSEEPQFKEQPAEEISETDPFEEEAENTAIVKKEYIPKRKITEEELVEVRSKNYIAGILIGFLILGGIGYGLFILTKKLTATPNYQVQTVSKVDESVIEEPALEITPMLKEEIKVTNARQVAEEYLNAQTAETALTLTRADLFEEEVFNKYWKPNTKYDPEKLKFNRAYSRSDGSAWVSFLYGELGGKRQLNMFSKAEEKFKLDWKAYSEIEEISLLDFSREADTVDRTIRAWIRPGSQFDADFKQELWINYAAYDVTGTRINLYVPSFSSHSSLLYKKLVGAPQNHPIGGRNGVYTILKVLKPTRSSQGAEIIDILDVTWTPEIDLE